MQMCRKITIAAVACALTVHAIGQGRLAVSAVEDTIQPQEKHTMNDPSTVNLDKIGHIMLGVSDARRSIAFYQETLGMRVLHGGGGMAFLDGGGVTLALSEELAKSQEHIAGAVEIVFAVDDLHHAHKVLSNRGVKFLREPRQVTDTDWAANFRDPDGHLLSIFGPPGKSAATAASAEE